MRTDSRSRDERRGSGFKSDAGMERLLELKEKNPAEFNKLSASLKVQLGYYANAKEAAERLGGSAA